MARGGCVLLLLAWAVALPSVARAFARGTVRVDVRDARGATVEAKVSLRAGDGTVRAAARVGEVYVAPDVVPGEYTIEIDAGGAEWQGARRVVVRERRVAGAVVVIAGAKATSGKGRRGAAAGTLRDGEAGCDAKDGALVEALGFARGLPAAGRVEVRAAGNGKAKGRLVCAAALAGGTADLRLTPGDYTITATFVGGGAAETFYRIVAGRAPPPLALRWK